MLLLPPVAGGAPLTNVVHHCDALALLRALPDASVDAVITDPPYGVGSLVSARRSPDERFDDVPNNLSVDTTWIPEAFRVLRPDSALYCFTTWRNFGIWQQALLSAGFDVKNCLVWDKMIHGLGDLIGSYSPRHEFILFAAKGRHILRCSRISDILRCSRIFPDELIHPYEKPISLLRQLIEHSTDPGSIVVDCFAGSGATLMAAKQTKRQFIGCDVAADYVTLAKQRLAVPYTLPLPLPSPEPERPAAQLALFETSEASNR